MKNWIKTFVLLCGLGWMLLGVGFAQEELLPVDEPVAGEEPVVPVLPEVEPVATNDVPPVVEEPPVEIVETPTNEVPPVVVEPSRPGKTPPVYRGSDMGAAFQGAGSSRYGISGRVHRLKKKKTAEKENGAWRRNIELGVNTSQGNSDTLRYNASLSASKDTDKTSYFLKASGRYGESKGETDAENADAEAKAQRQLTERMYAALEGNARHDQLADLAYRVRGSLSIGRHWVWTSRTVLNAEIGPGYVAEKKGGEEEGFLAGRAAQYLEFLVTESLQVWESVEFVQNIQDSGVYFVNSVVGLETILISNLSLRFTVEDRYDSQPAEGKVSNDLLTTTSLNWSF